MMARAAEEQRGAALVETAIALSVFVLIALGAFELGMAMRDWMSATSSSREGARVGAQAGDETGADCRILEAAAGALQSIEDDQVIKVWIFESDTTGAVVGNKQIYRPKYDTDDPATLSCGTWFRLENTWPEASRDNDGPVRDWMGVRVEFDHDWRTGFLMFSGSVCDRGKTPGADCWVQDTVMRLEPDPTP